MNKKIMYILFFIIVILIVFFILVSSTGLGSSLFKMLCAKKVYIQFEDIEKVTITYKSDGVGSLRKDDVIDLEVEVTDKEFFNLLEKNYKNKIINNYMINGVLVKGKYKINDNIEICPYERDYFCVVYNGKWIKAKFNEKIYDKMIAIIKTELDKIEDV